MTENARNVVVTREAKIEYPKLSEEFVMHKK